MSINNDFMNIYIIIFTLNTPRLYEIGGGAALLLLKYKGNIEASLSDKAI